MEEYYEAKKSTGRLHMALHVYYFCKGSDCNVKNPKSMFTAF